MFMGYTLLITKDIYQQIDGRIRPLQSNRLKTLKVIIEAYFQLINFISYLI